MPPAGGQRGRCPRRHPGGADRDRPRHPPLRRAGRLLHLGLPGGDQRVPRRAAAPQAPTHPRACPTTSARAIERGRGRHGPGHRGLPDRLAIDAALAQLPEEFRAAVVLRDLCDLDYAEIAEVLDIPPGTVRSRIAGAGPSWRASSTGEPGPRRATSYRPQRTRIPAMTDHDPLDDLASAHLDGTTRPTRRRSRGRPGPLARGRGAGGRPRRRRRHAARRPRSPRRRHHRGAGRVRRGRPRRAQATDGRPSRR